MQASVFRPRRIYKLNAKIKVPKPRALITRLGRAKENEDENGNEREKEKRDSRTCIVARTRKKIYDPVRGAIKVSRCLARTLPRTCFWARLLKLRISNAHCNHSDYQRVLQWICWLLFFRLTCRPSVTRVFLCSPRTFLKPFSYLLRRFLLSIRSNFVL